jgi:hypothetical protein
MISTIAQRVIALSWTRNQYPDTTQAVDVPVLPLTARHEAGMEYNGYFVRVKSITYSQAHFRLYQRYDQNK